MKMGYFLRIISRFWLRFGITSNIYNPTNKKHDPHLIVTKVSMGNQYLSFKEIMVDSQSVVFGDDYLNRKRKINQ